MIQEQRLSLAVRACSWMMRAHGRHIYCSDESGLAKNISFLDRPRSFQPPHYMTCTYLGIQAEMSCTFSIRFYSGPWRCVVRERRYTFQPSGGHQFWLRSRRSPRLKRFSIFFTYNTPRRNAWKPPCKSNAQTEKSTGAVTGPGTRGPAE